MLDREVDKVEVALQQQLIGAAIAGSPTMKPVLASTQRSPTWQTVGPGRGSGF